MLKKTFTKFINICAPVYDPFYKYIFIKDETRFRNKLCDLAKVKGNEYILDIGCGTGTFCTNMYKRLNANGNVYGIDISSGLIAKARKKAAQNRHSIAYQVSTASKIPFDSNYFDFVFSSMMMHLVSEKERIKILLEIKRVLKPHGKYICVEWSHIGLKKSNISHTGMTIKKKKEVSVSEVTIIPLHKIKLIYRVIYNKK